MWNATEPSTLYMAYSQKSVINSEWFQKKIMIMHLQILWTKRQSISAMKQSLVIVTVVILVTVNQLSSYDVMCYCVS
jgi:hypothetical protein